MAKFTPVSLDSLINDVAGSVSELNEELTTYDSEETNVVDPSINNMINQKHGMTVDFKRTYAQLEKLIENGNNALQIIQAIDPDVSDPSTLGSIATLMNAIRGCITEFNKIHLQSIKYQQTRDLLELKHQHKLDEINAKTQHNNDINDEDDVQVMQNWNSNEMLQFMKWKKEHLDN